MITIIPLVLIAVIGIMCVLKGSVLLYLAFISMCAYQLVTNTALQGSWFEIALGILIAWGVLQIVVKSIGEKE